MWILIRHVQLLIVVIISYIAIMDVYVLAFGMIIFVHISVCLEHICLSGLVWDSLYSILQCNHIIKR